MRVISRKAIVGFVAVHPDSRPSLDAWYRIALRARWRNLTEARSVLPHADPVEGLTVFNISGNKYRLIARVEYRFQKIYIRAILTHGDYDAGRWKK